MSSLHSLLVLFCIILAASTVWDDVTETFLGWPPSPRWGNYRFAIMFAVAYTAINSYQSRHRREDGTI